MRYLEYRISANISARDYPFYALIMAAMRKADTTNLGLLKQAWPGVWATFQARNEVPGGFLTDREARMFG